MVLAPLFFLRARQPSRSANWDKPNLALPDTANRTFNVHFELRRGLYVSTHSFPKHDATAQEQDKDTLFFPPPHYHLFADEHFLVTRGAGTWHLWDRDVRLKAGEKLYLPARAWHSFEGDRSAEAPLAVEVYFDKGHAHVEERFFRNILGYLSDCHREGIEPSVCQLLIFFHHFRMVPGLRVARWELLNLVLNLVIMYVAAFLGLLMGYEGSYDEYYREKKKTQ
ncbi:Cupin, RmlC-type [Cordyceps fumosorosea ARSEF 2679]|uniref:Cupin, RmlC-type n=1 Tax=Cordyceps fumosorosea (strain ARSEF 2679) TaxID=1081104 RepID=A0A167ZLZ0_CORFA|nr:Cupin, RmlC-type [Cordyceps fumosorosea ARSEF 2679]OAA67675.1 Cupin, RmlC-type [Cordyceps fumosorosea ARSEF 2679]